MESKSYEKGLRKVVGRRDSENMPNMEAVKGSDRLGGGKSDVQEVGGGGGFFRGSSSVRPLNSGVIKGRDVKGARRGEIERKGVGNQKREGPGCHWPSSECSRKKCG